MISPAFSDPLPVYSPETSARESHTNFYYSSHVSKSTRTCIKKQGLWPPQYNLVKAAGRETHFAAKAGVFFAKDVGVNFVLIIRADDQRIFNQSSVAAIRCYSAAKLTHIGFSGVFTSIRLPWSVEYLFSFYPDSKFPFTP
jgi:hypothetical protein